MAKSQRRLSFTPATEETTAAEGEMCTLCLAPHTQLSAPETWKNVQAQEIALTQLQLTKESLVCRLCRDNISKLVKKPDSTRRWEKASSKMKCCIDMCTNDVFAKSKIATREQIAHILQCENVSLPVPLCKHHYHLLYNTLHLDQTNTLLHLPGNITK